MRSALLLISLVCMFITAGCAGDGGPVSPECGIDGSVVGPATAAATSSRYLLGYWNVRIDPDSLEVSIIPVRSAGMHLNCIRLLEVTPCQDCLKIQNIQLEQPDVVRADIVLMHPYQTGNLKLSVFDVRAIFIGEADYTWPLSGRKMAVGESVPVMLNPDGYTSLFNPTEFPQTTPPALGYIEGNYTFPGDFTATLNPFTAFNKDEPRRIVRFGDTCSETVRIRFPSGPIEFGYAIDGCWQMFSGPCVDPVEDFPPDANCLEAYEISVWAGPGLSLDDGAWSYVYATVYDHQGENTIEKVTAEIPDVMSDVVEMEFYDERADGGLVYRGMVINQLDVDTGDYPYLIRIVDTEEDQNLGQIDAWYPGEFPVRNGWMLPWGNAARVNVWDMEITQDQKICVYGDTWIDNDMDPSPGDDLCFDGSTRYLSLFDMGGALEWCDVFEFYNSETGQICADQAGNIYIFDMFYGSIDVDPGPGIYTIESTYDDLLQAYYRNLCLIKINPDGGLEWEKHWPGTASINAFAVAGNASDVYIAGTYDGIQDLDPGIGESMHQGDREMFVIKFDTDGMYLWDFVIGSDGGGIIKDIEIASDDNVILCGVFHYEVDFDPGPDECILDGNALQNSFLAKYDEMSNFLWVRAVTSSEDCDYDTPALVLDHQDNIYMGHEFMGIVDFDGGPGMDLHTSNGEGDCFLTKYDSDGNYEWVITWGGPFDDSLSSLDMDCEENLLVLGKFRDTVDFDPGPGEENRTALGKSNFLLKIDENLNFQWVAVWYFTLGRSLAHDSENNLYLGGSYTHNMPAGLDFDPSPDSVFFYPRPTSNHMLAYILKMPYDFEWW